MKSLAADSRATRGTFAPRDAGGPSVPDTLGAGSKAAVNEASAVVTGGRGTNVLPKTGAVTPSRARNRTTP